MAICEWNPAADKPATEVVGKPESRDGCEREATLSVGTRTNWHLCEDCAMLPRFKRLRKRVPLRVPRINCGDRGCHDYQELIDPTSGGFIRCRDCGHEVDCEEDESW